MAWNTFPDATLSYFGSLQIFPEIFKQTPVLLNPNTSVFEGNAEPMEIRHLRSDCAHNGHLNSRDGFFSDSGKIFSSGFMFLSKDAELAWIWMNRLVVAAFIEILYLAIIITELHSLSVDESSNSFPPPLFLYWYFSFRRTSFNIQDRPHIGGYRYWLLICMPSTGDNASHSVKTSALGLKDTYSSILKRGRDPKKIIFSSSLQNMGVGVIFHD